MGEGGIKDDCWISSSDDWDSGGAMSGDGEHRNRRRAGR